MKAIVMAGGEGTRLQPLTTSCPKPMIRILDRPVLEYILALLHDNGIDDICLTLKYLPDAIIAHFGDGAAYGVRLQSRLESEPLGTAGGVRACLDFLGDEEVLIISGDCICNFDLRSCIDFHRARNADATIVLYNHPEPPEYGLVVTGAEGRIERFVEKPPWEHVVTGDVSTGIYMLSPQTVRSIPDGVAFDFGRDMFPRMLQENRRLYAVRAEGYWCDIGSPESYLKCCYDVLSGEVRLPLSSPRVRGGVWSSSVLPSGAVYAPPIYVGEKVEIETGAKLGPNTVIGTDSFVGRGASVTGSVVDGAVIRPGAVIEGSVIGRGTVVGENAVLRDGCVIGEHCILGNDSIISEHVKIWPFREIPCGERITENVTGKMTKSSLSFSSGGTISGGFGSVITPETCLAVGSAAAASQTGVSHDGKPASAVLAEAICCGAAAAGGRVTMFDAPYPAVAAFTGGLYGLKTTIFCSSKEEDTFLAFFGSDGIAVPRSVERRFEAALRGEIKQVPAHAVSVVRRITGSCDAFEARAASECGNHGALTVSVRGRSPENKTLSAVFKEAGCTLSEQRRGIPSFDVAAGGFLLSATDEEGRRISSDHMLLITALSAFETGCKTVAVAFSAPAALDRLAANCGCRILRLERNTEEAAGLYFRQPFMQYGAFAAALICRVMRENNVTLASLYARVPSFSTTEREVPVVGARGEIMSALRASCTEMATDLFQGLTAYAGSAGRVQMVPCRDRAAVIIRAESETEELAEELCCDFERRLRKLDSENY